ncbi:MAG: hypothetical protein Q9P14_00945 [candidate division KSB1 bacterium]|nr:hypothetical protein [candidate division KSB1 bacterium]
MKLSKALKGEKTLGFDTAPIIYFIEAHPQYDTLVAAIFQKIADQSILGLTSVITLAEVLVQPFAA